MTRTVVAAQGRFHAFELVRGLIELGRDVTLLTNWPARLVEPFGIPRQHVRSFVLHGMAARLAGRIGGHTAEPLLHRAFGAWTARELATGDYAAVHLWSSIAREWLYTHEGAAALHRSSSHIRAQRQLLDEEEQRVGVSIDKPTDWMIEREEAEYARAPVIVVLAEFSRRTFQQHGVAADRVVVVPIAGPAPQFEATEQQLEERVQRLRANAPLRVLYVGSVSYRKGMYDFEQMVSALPASRFEFRAVGPVLPECQPLYQRLASRVSFTGSVPAAQLPGHYAWADLFILPTIEDGFPLVSAQAAAAGVPILISTNCGGPELIQQGAAGWVLPPRDAALWTAALREADGAREALADKIRAARDWRYRRSWRDVAAQLTQLTDSRIQST